MNYTKYKPLKVTKGNYIISVPNFDVL